MKVRLHRRNAAPAAAGPEELARRERLRRHVIRALFAVVFVVGMLAALFGDRGFLDVHRSRTLGKRLAADVEACRGRVAALRGEIERLRSDPAALERIAREDLGLARSGEVVFLLPKGLGERPAPESASP